MKLKNPVHPHKTTSAITADAGTLIMEFAYLSHITKDKTFRNKAYAIMERLSQLKTAYEALLPHTVHIEHQGIQPGSTFKFFRLTPFKHMQLVEWSILIMNIC